MPLSHREDEAGYGIAQIVTTVSIIEVAIPISLLLGVVVFLWLGIAFLREKQFETGAPRMQGT